MTETEIRAVVERVLRKLGERPSSDQAALEEPGGGCLADIAKADLAGQYLVDKPHDREAFMALREKTPARVGIGHAGARHRTQTMLRFQADHAAAQDAVFSDVDDAFLEELGLPRFQTLCGSRDEFLTRPDKGRSFAPETLERIAAHAGMGAQVAVYLADGLSSTAVKANAADILPVITKGLEGFGVRVANPFFVQYGRVGSMDPLGERLKAEIMCVLLGERPGLITSESMSAYIAYRPSAGMAESRRTVLANIHRGATPTVEAGAHIVDLIRLMLEKKVSGVDLPI